MPSKVSYTYSFADYRGLYKALRGWVPYDLLGLSAIVIGTILFLSYWNERPLRFDLWNVFLTTSGLAVAFVFARSAMLLCHWIVFKRSSLVNGRLELTFNDNGIHFATGVTTGTISWEGIKRIVETRHGLYLLISKIEAISVPRRAVADAEFRLIREIAAENVERPA